MPQLHLAFRKSSQLPRVENPAQSFLGAESRRFQKFAAKKKTASIQRRRSEFEQEAYLYFGGGISRDGGICLSPSSS